MCELSNPLRHGRRQIHARSNTDITDQAFKVTPDLIRGPERHSSFLPMSLDFRLRGNDNIHTDCPFKHRHNGAAGLGHPAIAAPERRLG